MANINTLNFNAGEEMSFLSTPAEKTEYDSLDVMNSSEVYRARLDTCMDCQYITSERMCSECNCPVVMMAQMNFKTCPKGMW